MRRFLQLHLLTSYPPANLNRDDLGRPKTAVMGGVLRLRISSQSLKRAWRTSDLFATSLQGHVGTRTKEMGIRIYRELLAKGIKEKDAMAWAGQIAGQFGKSKGADKNNPLAVLEIEQLAHFSPEEEEAIRQLNNTLAERRTGPEEGELQLLRKRHSAADIAMFGRMLASAPAYNVEAAVQVAHALGVHRCQVEDDFFTAVDDLNDGQEDKGSAHMGDTAFGAALFYQYICVDRQQLLANLGEDRPLADLALRALLECAATVAPGGKQNSFASRAYASYMLAELGDRQPRSLSVAFLRPVSGADLLVAAVRSIQQSVTQMDAVYGPCADLREEMSVLDGRGTLSALQGFAIQE
ncbi:MAG: type I-E CRISPR-associated protein Cas7/Cse4/CasC [Magnetococcales bacterium]|nr:type I-E CRISPR-associated protein Cas7/Cse4/CasC [Magnetococcales bacterium]